MIRIRRLAYLCLISAFFVYCWGILASHLTGLDNDKICAGAYTGYESVTMNDVVRWDQSLIPLKFECYFNDGSHEDIAASWANWVTLVLFLAAVGCCLLLVKLNRRSSLSD